MCSTLLLLQLDPTVAEVPPADNNNNNNNNHSL
jgi:hypothetical protein